MSRSHAPRSLLDSEKDDPQRTIIVPTFGATGAPDYDAGATALIAGLDYSSDAVSLARAMARGIVHESVHAASLLGTNAISHLDGFALAGGGSRSPYWNRWRAAAFGKPVSTRTYHDCGCIGAALLAFAGMSGKRPDLEIFNPQTVRIEPDDKDIAIFQRDHDRYVDLRARILKAEQGGPRA